MKFASIGAGWLHSELCCSIASSCLTAAMGMYAADSTDSNRTARSSTAAQNSSCLMVLICRCCVVAADCSGQEYVFVPSGPAPITALELLLKGMQCLQPQLQTVLHAAGTAAGPASDAASQQLQEQSAELQRSVAGALQECQAVWGHTGNNESSSSLVPVAGSQEVLGPGLKVETANKLKQQGEALCAMLPVPDCCNNPGCICFRGDSEQQLVGGKSCVCAG